MNYKKQKSTLRNNIMLISWNNRWILLVLLYNNQLKPTQIWVIDVVISHNCKAMDLLKLKFNYPSPINFEVLIITVSKLIK